MTRLSFLLSSRRRAVSRTCEDGQTTLEWMGIAAVVVALLAVLLLARPGLGSNVQQTWSCLFSQVVGDGGACADGLAAGEPDRACTTSLTVGEAIAGVRIAIVDLEGGKQVIIREDSDGRVHVTFVDKGSIGVSAQVGGGGGVDLGELEGEARAEAEAGIALTGELGDTRVFENGEDARAYIIDRATDEALETALGPIGGPIATGAKDIIGGIFGYDPPQGEAENTHGQAGVTANGSADIVVAEVEASASAGGRVTQNADGSRTLRISLSATAAGELGIPLVDVGASGAQTVRLEIDYDADGDRTTARIVSITDGTFDGGLSPSISNPADVLKTVSGTAGAGDGGRTVVTAELDLTDPDVGGAIGDLLGATTDVATGNGSTEELSDAADVVLDELAENGTVAIESYDLTTVDAGISAEGNIGIGLGGSLGVEGSQATLTNAVYFDPITGEFVPWEACTGN